MAKDLIANVPPPPPDTALDQDWLDAATEAVNTDRSSMTAVTPETAGNPLMEVAQPQLQQDMGAPAAQLPAQTPAPQAPPITPPQTGGYTVQGGVSAAQPQQAQPLPEAPLFGYNPFTGESYMGAAAGGAGPIPWSDPFEAAALGVATGGVKAIEMIPNFLLGAAQSGVPPEQRFLLRGGQAIVGSPEYQRLHAEGLGNTLGGSEIVGGMIAPIPGVREAMAIPQAARLAGGIAKSQGVGKAAKTFFPNVQALATTKTLPQAGVNIARMAGQGAVGSGSAAANTQLEERGEVYDPLGVAAQTGLGAAGGAAIGGAARALVPLAQKIGGAIGQTELGRKVIKSVTGRVLAPQQQAPSAPADEAAAAATARKKLMEQLAGGKDQSPADYAKSLLKQFTEAKELSDLPTPDEVKVDIAASKLPDESKRLMWQRYAEAVRRISGDDVGPAEGNVLPAAQGRVAPRAKSKAELSEDEKVDYRAIINEIRDAQSTDALEDALVKANARFKGNNQALNGINNAFLESAGMSTTEWERILDAAEGMGAKERAIYLKNNLPDELGKVKNAIVDRALSKAFFAKAPEDIDVPEGASVPAPEAPAAPPPPDLPALKARLSGFIEKVRDNPNPSVDEKFDLEIERKAIEDAAKELKLPGVTKILNEEIGAIKQARVEAQAKVEQVATAESIKQQRAASVEKLKGAKSPNKKDLLEIERPKAKGAAEQPTAPPASPPGERDLSRKVFVAGSGAENVKLGKSADDLGLSKTTKELLKSQVELKVDEAQTEADIQYLSQELMKKATTEGKTRFEPVKDLIPPSKEDVAALVGRISAIDEDIAAEFAKAMAAKPAKDPMKSLVYQGLLDIRRNYIADLSKKQRQLLEKLKDKLTDIADKIGKRDSANTRLDLPTGERLNPSFAPADTILGIEKQIIQLKGHLKATETVRKTVNRELAEALEPTYERGRQKDPNFDLNVLGEVRLSDGSKIKTVTRFDRKQFQQNLDEEANNLFQAASKALKTHAILSGQAINEWVATKSGTMLSVAWFGNDPVTWTAVIATAIGPKAAAKLLSKEGFFNPALHLKKTVGIIGLRNPELERGFWEMQGNIHQQALAMRFDKIPSADAFAEAQAKTRSLSGSEILRGVGAAKDLTEAEKFLTAIFKKNQQEYADKLQGEIDLQSTFSQLKSRLGEKDYDAQLTAAGVADPLDPEYQSTLKQLHGALTFQASALGTGDKALYRLRQAVNGYLFANNIYFNQINRMDVQLMGRPLLDTPLKSHINDASKDLLPGVGDPDVRRFIKTYMPFFGTPDAIELAGRAERKLAKPKGAISKILKIRDVAMEYNPIARSTGEVLNSDLSNLQQVYTAALYKYASDAKYVGGGKQFIKDILKGKVSEDLQVDAFAFAAEKADQVTGAMTPLLNRSFIGRNKILGAVLRFAEQPTRYATLATEMINKKQFGRLSWLIGLTALAGGSAAIPEPLKQFWSATPEGAVQYLRMRQLLDMINVMGHAGIHIEEKISLMNINLSTQTELDKFFAHPTESLVNLIRDPDDEKKQRSLAKALVILAAPKFLGTSSAQWVQVVEAVQNYEKKEKTVSVYDGGRKVADITFPYGQQELLHDLVIVGRSPVEAEAREAAIQQWLREQSRGLADPKQPKGLGVTVPGSKSFFPQG